jgi:hypothetical protein
MVTTNVKTSRIFTLAIGKPIAGAIRIAITDEEGDTRTYTINAFRLRTLALANPDVKDAVDFLLGDAHA